MTPSASDRIELLREHIKSRFKEGILVGGDVLHYIDSTLSNPTSDEIASILLDECHPERDPLLELIFYPDLSIQTSLERLLHGHACSEEDYERLRSTLCRYPLTTSIHFADGREAIAMTISSRLMDVFLQRLNLTRAVAGRILETIEKYVSEADRALTIVTLRNARRVPQGNAANFLCSYIKHMVSDRLYWDGLEFTLSFLEHIDADTDIYPALMRKKLRCYHILKEIERSEDKRRSDNIETLMLRGERFAHADRQDVLKSITIIDRIAMAVYGKTDWGPPPSGGTESVSVRSEADLKNLIRLFSASHEK